MDVEQSNLDYGIYEYQACAEDVGGLTGCTDIQTYNIVDGWIYKTVNTGYAHVYDDLNYTLSFGAY